MRSSRAHGQQAGSKHTRNGHAGMRPWASRYSGDWPLVAAACLRARCLLLGECVVWWGVGRMWCLLD